MSTPNGHDIDPHTLAPAVPQLEQQLNSVPRPYGFLFLVARNPKRVRKVLVALDTRVEMPAFDDPYPSRPKLRAPKHPQTMQPKLLQHPKGSFYTRHCMKLG